MARGWTCPRCSTKNGEGIVNCATCGLIRGGVVVPGSYRGGPQRPPRRRLGLYVAIIVAFVVASAIVSWASRGSFGMTPPAVTTPPQPAATATPRHVPTASPRIATDDPTAQRLVNVRDLRVGDCWDGATTFGPDDAGNVTVRPCTREHQLEVIWTGSMPDGPYPTSDEPFWEYVVTDCASEFGAYVGVDWTHSTLVLWPSYPTADAWLEGDRFITCSVVDMDADKLTASVKGSKR